MNLRYGINPGQLARSSIGQPGCRVRLIAGEPSYINVLDAVNAWGLVVEASAALGAVAATSFKHVSPAGAAVAGHLDDVMASTWGVGQEALTPAAAAYVRARDCDPKSSYGDFVAVSAPVDWSLAAVLRTVISDGIIAPSFEPGTVELLAAKKNGSFILLEGDLERSAPAWERRECQGLVLEQQTEAAEITREVVQRGALEAIPDTAVDDLVLAMVTARYTQSNAVTYAKGGLVRGVGAGQQSRVDCTKLAGQKSAIWWLRRCEVLRNLRFRRETRRQERINWEIRYIEGDMTPNERERFASVLEEPAPDWPAAAKDAWSREAAGLALASDGYIPFRDNVDLAARYGVNYIAHPGGSIRNPEVEAAAREHHIVMSETGIRLFHH